MAETEEARTTDVLLRLDAADVHRAVKALTANRQQNLARLLHTPVTVLTTADGAADILRRRAKGLTRASVSALARDLVEVCADETIVALGESYSDPSYEELVGVIDDVVDHWGERLVALLLAATADGDLPARDVCLRLLDEDPRFALDALGDVQAEAPVRSVSKAPAVSEEERAAKREERRRRREAKPAKKGAPKRGAPKYRKKVSAPGGADAADDLFDENAPELSVGERPLSTSDLPMRAVKLIGHYPNARHDHPMVGAVVTAFIPFRPRPEVEPIGKVRPCVVIAVDDGDNLIVRPCYSEGGLRSRSWRSVLVTNPRVAGLRATGYVSDDEYQIPRARVTGPIGWLAREDWNML